MSLISELKKYSKLKSEADIKCFSDIARKMAASKDNRYISVILLSLDDESEHIDLMKVLIGMAESFNSVDYVQCVLDNIEALNKFAPDWLEHITYRITNSEDYSSTYKALLKTHPNNDAIRRFLINFSKANPEKNTVIESIVEDDNLRSLCRRPHL